MELIFTTTNEYKIKSADSVLSRYGINVAGREVEVPELQTSDPEEVIKDKVAKCYEIVKQPLIAMDSGLFIEPLGGFPGVYTKYALKTLGEDGLINLTKHISPCPAYVQRMIGYTDGFIIKTFSSRGYGEIIPEKRGENGMNYDLIFYVPSEGKTLAELTHEQQVAVWGDAWDNLALYLTS
ncbi:non-canonical purine NTP pyrophosphatase [candidate division WWE3 bacterium CG08_land_8_20_14_0_20_43_13]|uniref:Non-canonical purine NTP pyrophosphatase n=2 Tax=Bacteria candidate phyla TaxID=1783234 RepID=A0A2H0X7R9_UNCKA|nr:MAG: non-canonical purine NTP pyrophosphatase [candidate division WWE3 bacterium CG08_land_8_20_14_0_20_43_13]PJE73238.1 MAG: non-canonical purine NTP pyrophosphatase [Candidatus Tagabacteria bacterium CG10_big_fil_rev_8_21_14_0_10_40_13]